MAAHNGHTRALRVLITARADIDRPNKRGVAPIFIAAAFGHADALGVLIASRARVSQTDIDGATPLHIAASTGRVNTVAILLRADAPCDALWHDKKPIDLARQQGHDHIVRLLASCTVTTHLDKGLEHQIITSKVTPENTCRMNFAPGN